MCEQRWEVEDLIPIWQMNILSLGSWRENGWADPWPGILGVEFDPVNVRLPQSPPLFLSLPFHGVTFLRLGSLMTRFFHFQCFYFII